MASVASASATSLAGHAAKMALATPRKATLGAADLLPYAAASDALATVDKVLADGKATPAAVEGALALIKELAETLGAAALPHLLPLLGGVLERQTERAESIKGLSTAAANAMMAAVDESTIGAALAAIYTCLPAKRKWQTRAAAVALIASLATRLPSALYNHVVALVPRLSECMTDARTEVSSGAEAAMAAVAPCAENRDIAGVVPRIISAIARPVEVPEAVHALSATTFVQQVLSPALALLVPLLVRGLNDRGIPIKRKAAVIISNMARLVPDPAFAAPLIPLLLPGLKKLRDEVTDPEVRDVATKAFDTLLKATRCDSEAAAMALAKTMSDAQAAKDSVAREVKERAEKAAASAAKAKTAVSTKAKTGAFKKPTAGAKKAAAAAEAAAVVAADAAAALPTRFLEPAVEAALASLEAILSAQNLDLAAGLSTAAAAVVPEATEEEEAAGGAGAEGKASASGASAAGIAATVEAATVFVASNAASLAENKAWSETAWRAAVQPFLRPLVALVPTVPASEVDAKTDAVAIALLDRTFEATEGRSRASVAAAGEADVTDPDAEDASIKDLCDCTFSLAYGGKILLNTASLHMKMGRAYGLVGPNGCGKTTLMRAIANGQLEGFPSREELPTFYVESNIPSELEDATCIDFVLLDPLVRIALKLPPIGAAAAGGAGAASPTPSEESDDGEAGDVPASPHPHLAFGEPHHFVKPSSTPAAVAEVTAQLSELSFTPSMITGKVGGLSGGWRMRLALARAFLSKASLFLLDEPTNHLDVRNVAWLTNYLKALTDRSIMVVSHDSAFLDAICSHVIAYTDGFKLKTYKGNLSAYAERNPAARSYFDLGATPVTWSFPEPGFLDGVRSRDKAILKVMSASYTYPGRDTPALKHVNVAVSLSSRVVISGPNGAGKSTLIKILTGEIEPTEGTMWKHPALRIAYVAQHAMHHLEPHLDKTPAEYVAWRYASGEDRESLVKASRVISEEERKRMEAVQVIGGVKMVVSAVLARRKSGRSWEYEVSWVGQPADKNQWMPREWLEAIGWGKAVDALDARAAAEAGLHSRPLTATNIAKHLEGLGLEPEFTLHSRIRGLSGGQKVKVILGAAMWCNPQVIALDEPSNFIDRDSLGALAAAVKDFQGGVLLITHAKDLVTALASEHWNVVDGVCTVSGGGWSTETIEKPLAADETVDAAGNVIKIKKTLELTGKAKRKADKEKAARRRRGEDTDDEDM